MSPSVRAAICDGNSGAERAIGVESAGSERRACHQFQVGIERQPPLRTTAIATKNNVPLNFMASMPLK